MNTATRSVWDLTDPSATIQQRQAALHAFAAETGWRPSDNMLDYPGTEEIATGHLLVEHGMDNTAAITFLRQTRPFPQLPIFEQRQLLAISYNNLVDWHYFPHREGVWAVFNRTNPLIIRAVTLSEQPNAWRSDAFDTTTGPKPSPNLPALDDALIRTVSLWKRLLSSELEMTGIEGPISDLFNAIFFVRAIEDNRRKNCPDFTRKLLSVLRNGKKERPIRKLLAEAIQDLAGDAFPKDLFAPSKLKVFDRLHSDTVEQLFMNFYDNRFAPYQYDFSLMSKHAMSRIYEHYITVLRAKPSEQLTFFSELPEELSKRNLGGIYTPQYIARFFSRVLQESYTPKLFRSLRVADPACGSGIFLRTVAELQCSAPYRGKQEDLVKEAFSGIFGMDTEDNACKAARLSLSLLYLSLTGAFPAAINIQTGNAITDIPADSSLAGSFDAVIANPPFVKWENIPKKWQGPLASLVKGDVSGKPDLYLGFIKLGLDIVKPEGFLLYVLPHTFLLAENAKLLRARIAREFHIRYLVDLSDMDVFEDVNAYPILLVAQRKCDDATDNSAVVVRCLGFPGRALADALDGKTISNAHYSIQQVPQAAFSSPAWRILPPQEAKIFERIQKAPIELRELAIMKEGFITGADSVFIRRKTEIPPGEEAAYAPYLSDRMMERYTVPQETGEVVFYPMRDDGPMTEDEVKSTFPATWEYLESKSDRLKPRKSLSRVGIHNWWRPLWPRPRRHLLTPKLVSPHLILYPKFSLDAVGKYAVSRSPILFPVSGVDTLRVLKYLLAVLNSTVGHWQISTVSHKYQRGYAKLEPITLKQIRIISPAVIPARTMNRIQSLVDAILAEPSNRDAEECIDRIVASLYGVDLDAIKGTPIPFPVAKHVR